MSFNVEHMPCNFFHRKSNCIKVTSTNEDHEAKNIYSDIENHYRNVKRHIFLIKIREFFFLILIWHLLFNWNSLENHISNLYDNEIFNVWSVHSKSSKYWQSFPLFVINLWLDDLTLFMWLKVINNIYSYYFFSH